MDPRDEELIRLRRRVAELEAENGRLVQQLSHARSMAASNLFPHRSSGTGPVRAMPLVGTSSLQSPSKGSSMGGYGSVSAGRPMSSPAKGRSISSSSSSSSSSPPYYGSEPVVGFSLNAAFSSASTSTPATANPSGTATAVASSSTSAPPGPPPPGQVLCDNWYVRCIYIDAESSVVRCLRVWVRMLVIR